MTISTPLRAKASSLFSLHGQNTKRLINIINMSVCLDCLDIMFRAIKTSWSLAVRTMRSMSTHGMNVVATNWDGERCSPAIIVCRLNKGAAARTCRGCVLVWTSCSVSLWLHVHHVPSPFVPWYWQCFWWFESRKLLLGSPLGKQSYADGRKHLNEYLRLLRNLSNASFYAQHDQHT